MTVLKDILIKTTKAAIIVAVPFVLMFAGAFITMIIAVRGKEVIVPDVVGKEQTAAQDTLIKSNLRPAISGRCFSAVIPAGYVASQYPEKGTKVKAQNRIKLMVSEGKKRITVPNLVGLSPKDTQTVLEESGLRPGFISRVQMLETTKETVLRQFPAAGTTNVQTPYINLLLNRPADQTSYIMPDFRGLRSQDVSLFLEKNGFMLRPTEYESRPLQPVGSILAHFPEPGYPLSRSTPIVLVVCR